MRKYEVEIGNSNRFRIYRVKANTDRGALKRALKILKKRNIAWEFIYQISTRKKGSLLWQPVYDYINGLYY